jgi:hypothetical protein
MMALPKSMTRLMLMTMMTMMMIGLVAALGVSWMTNHLRQQH